LICKYITELFLGDSGGGMVLKVNDLWKIIGIVSSGNLKIVNDIKGVARKTCNLGLFSVFTDVSKYYDWINQVVLETIL
jgi:secreted trypsin-like serine protease